MRRLLVLPSALVVLAGCGQTATNSAEEFAGAERVVAQVVEDLQSAGEQRDAEKICADLLAQDLVRQLDRGGTSCRTEIERAIQDVEDFELVVEDVTVTGDTARATVRRVEGDGDRPAQFTFVRVGGGWRAADLGTGG